MKIRYLAAAGAAVAALIVGAASCGEDGGSGDDTGGKTPSATKTTKKAAAPNAAAKATAHKVTAKLGTNGMKCKWKPGDNKGGIVYQMLCNKREMILAAGDDHTSVKVWLEGMEKESPAGWVLVRNKYAIVSPDHGTINRAYDLLGAKGEVRSIGGK